MTETTLTITTAQPMMTDEAKFNEVKFKLPFGQMLGVAILVSVLFGSMSYLFLKIGIGPTSAAWEYMIGTSVSLGVAVAGMFMMKPWKSRPITSWMSFWLGSIVLRLLATPALAFLLYSTTSLSLTPFMLSIAVSYLAILFSEAVVLAMYVKRVT